MQIGREMSVAPRPRPLAPGTRVVARDGTTYVTEGPEGSTLRRATPTRRGKAARREDKRSRRLARGSG